MQFDLDLLFIQIAKVNFKIILIFFCKKPYLEEFINLPKRSWIQGVKHLTQLETATVIEGNKSQDSFQPITDDRPSMFIGSIRIISIVGLASLIEQRTYLHSGWR